MASSSASSASCPPRWWRRSATARPLRASRNLLSSSIENGRRPSIAASAYLLARLPQEAAFHILGLLDLLRALTDLLRCVGGDDIPLYRLRVWLAAQLILDNPGLVPFDNSGHDDDYIAAAEEGERLADEL